MMNEVLIGDLAYGSFEPSFLDLCVKLITQCAEEGIYLQPYSGVRSPAEQAKLWRRSRSFGEVQVYIRKLKEWNAPYLSNCLEDVGPQPHAAWVTNALPGESWHQWGEAMDCHILDEEENIIHNGAHPKYQQYGKIAEDLGLTAGVFWQRRDAGHVQLRKESVKSIYNWPDIDAAMQQKFNQ